MFRSEGPMEEQHVVRWVKSADIESVAKIDKQSFPNAWHEEDFHRVLKVKTNHILVAEVDKKIVAYALAMRFRGWVDIHRMATHPGHRRQGIGSLLVESLAMREAWKQPWLTAVINETETGVNDFLRSCAMKPQRMIRGDVPECGHDAYEFVRPRWSGA